MGGLSIDPGALDLGVESAWTRGDQVTAGVKRSLSLRAEAPTSDQLSTDSWLGALGALSKISSPPTGDGENASFKVNDDGEGSAAMSVSPLGSVVGLHTSQLVVCESKGVDFATANDNVNEFPHQSMSWLDSPDDKELVGEVPEFPVLSPSVRSTIFISSKYVAFGKRSHKRVEDE
ncbi:uncharacterized protein F5147DRAFT_675968 [Suillus discolor]|uniref:Uncharacterized protein n=1 Tax=Suillus discolor TaxID=1912936 RepID=A0A9P7JZ06_9AGAM|nr:uncharacterized protein F5147DRAFT_675968 [Suillus discolor]KAG2116099.1 hypothetical protein F5147DRAFT_675968 [Suillus discolor]